MLSDIVLLELNCNLLIHSYSFIDLEAIFFHVRLPTPIYAYAIYPIIPTIWVASRCQYMNDRL